MRSTWPCPTPSHAEWTTRALRAGKAVLSEKPLCVGSAQTAEVLDAARDIDGALLWEAFVFPFQAQHRRLAELLAEGAIGQPAELVSVFHFHPTRPGDIRFSAALGGGSLADVGCYPIRLAHELFGAADDELAAGSAEVFGEVEVDAAGLVPYGARRLLLSCGFRRSYDTFTQVLGSEGQLHLTNPFHPGPADTLTLHQPRPGTGRGAPDHRRALVHRRAAAHPRGAARRGRARAPGPGLRAGHGAHPGGREGGVRAVTADGLTIVIGSYLEEEHVQRIAAAEAAGRVIYEPELLPVPRYRCDHTGPRRDLSPADLDRWRALGAEAEVYFDFDWLDPGQMPERSPKLRWIQATSAGIGGFMQRTGLDGAGLEVTTAAGVHAVPLAEFALTGALYFVKGLPELRRRQQARHWERYTTRQLAGLRALVVGLGGIGRQVAATFAALGVEVWGLGRTGRTYDVAGLSRVITAGGLDAGAAARPTSSCWPAR